MSKPLFKISGRDINLLTAARDANLSWAVLDDSCKVVHVSETLGSLGPLAMFYANAKAHRISYVLNNLDTSPQEIKP